jgi:serine phosphatase RsbU (regulator of sigma subunit)/pSer/pThr/pTyr-binding forkhead associated (FHA) protein
MAYLVVRRGPKKEQRLSLDRDLTVIGRDTHGCDIWLAPPGPGHLDKQESISRRHAVITREGTAYYIADGNGSDRPSRNHTEVNGVRVELPDRKRLKHGDVITICYYELVFQDDMPTPIADPDPSSSIDATLSPHHSSVVEVQSGQKLRTLLEISNQLSRTRDLESLLPTVVEILLRLFPQANRAFLILKDEQTGALDPRAFQGRQPEDAAECRFSASIVQRCLQAVEGVLVNNPGKQFPEAGSISELSVRSALGAPLWLEKGKAIGLLLLDSRQPKRPFTEDDLNLLVGVANQVSIAFANAQHHRDVLVWEHHKQDLAFARDVVKSFLPDQLPAISGYEFFVSYEAALTVGGDYYDFIPLPEQRLAILVGDVAGKGVAAALVMARFSALVQACLHSEPDAALAVRRLNELTQSLCRTDRFITLLLLVLDPMAHVVTVINAGHPAPILVRQANGTLEDGMPISEIGPPLAIAAGYEYRSHQFCLHLGDTVALFTDGVPDAADHHERRLEVKGLRALLCGGRAAPREMGERILRGVEQHVAGCRQFDDMTLVCFGRDK